MSSPPSFLHSRLAAVAVLLAALGPASSSCTVKFITEYDQVMDEEVTRLQGDVESFLTQMETKAGSPQGTYAENSAFYADLHGALTALRVRAEAADKAELFVEHMDLLMASVRDLKQIHEGRGQAGMDSTLIDPARSALTMQFRAILKLNAALREGR